MKLPWKTRKQRAIERWNNLADRYEVLSDEAHRRGDSLPFATHYRIVSSIYRVCALEMKRDRK